MLIMHTHTTGKTHGAASSDDYVSGAPAASGIEAQQFGWANSYQTGAGPDAITSGIEVVWSKTPTQWGNDFLHSLFGNEWTLQTGPGGAYQWIALNGTNDYPDAFSNTTFHLPRMMTSDLALREDPTYANISKSFRDDFETFTYEFAHAWYVPPVPSDHANLNARIARESKTVHPIRGSAPRELGERKLTSVLNLGSN